MACDLRQWLKPIGNKQEMINVGQNMSTDFAALVRTWCANFGHSDHMDIVCMNRQKKVCLDDIEKWKMNFEWSEQLPIIHD